MNLFKRILGFALAAFALFQLLTAIGSYTKGKPSHRMAVGLIVSELVGAYGIWLVVQSFKKPENEKSSEII
ncbi:MAG: hypothetical protein V4642_09785 [Bacteroidota bacterium]